MSAGADAVVATRELVKIYAAYGVPVRAVDGVDLVVEAGETVSVMGPSGCGKTALLRLLGGLERPDAGQIVLDGCRVDGLLEKAWAVLRWPTSNPLETSHNVGHR